MPHLAVPHDAPNLWGPWKHVWPPSKPNSSATITEEVDTTPHPWQEAMGEDVELARAVAQGGAAVGTMTGVVDPQPQEWTQRPAVRQLPSVTVSVWPTAIFAPTTFCLSVEAQLVTAVPVSTSTTRAHTNTSTSWQAVGSLLLVLQRNGPPATSPTESARNQSVP